MPQGETRSLQSARRPRVDEDKGEKLTRIDGLIVAWGILQMLVLPAGVRRHHMARFLVMNTVHRDTASLGICGLPCGGGRFVEAKGNPCQDPLAQTYTYEFVPRCSVRPKSSVCAASLALT